jgi:hypothetical protein
LCRLDVPGTCYVSLFDRDPRITIVIPREREGRQCPGRSVATQLSMPAAELHQFEIDE